jgi:hypothetical protein
MNNSKLIIIAFVSAFIFTACEKETDNNPAIKQTVNSKSDIRSINKSNPPGSDSPYWDNIENFIAGIMEQNWAEDMEVHQSLYYTESTLDWRFTGREDNVERRITGEQLEYNLSSNLVGGEEQLTASQILSLNEDIHDDIELQAQDLVSQEGSNIIVEIVDLEWEVNSSSVVVYVNALYGVVNSSFGPTSCTFTDAKGWVKEKCNSTAYINAAQVIDLETRVLCNTWNNDLRCNGINKITINQRRSTITGIISCGSFLWDGKTYDCRTASQNTSDFHSARSVWNNQCVPFPGQYIRTVRYWSRKYTPNDDAQHQVTYYTIDGCRTICPGFPSCPVSDRPRPLFN